MLDEVVRRDTVARLAVGMPPGTMPALAAVAARRAAVTDPVAEITASGVRAVVPGLDADTGSDKPHRVHPHTLVPVAESGMSNRDVPRFAPGEAANVVGRA
jgi:hypothetical protein